MSFFTDLFGSDDDGISEPKKLHHDYGYEDELDFKPKKTAVRRNVPSEAKKPSMVQLHPPIDKVHLKDNGDVAVAEGDTKMNVGSSSIEVKEVVEDKETTGEHLYKAEVVKDDDIVGQAVVYTKDTDPVIVEDDTPVQIESKSMMKSSTAAYPMMTPDEYRNRVRQLAGGRLSDDEPSDGGYNILDLETPLGDLDLNTGNSHEIIDFSTPIVSARAGNKKKDHLLAVDTPLAGVSAGGSFLGVDTPIGSADALSDRSIVGVDTPIADVHAGGSLVGVDTPIGGVHAGNSYIGVETPIASMHAGCRKCTSKTMAECHCQKKSLSGRKYHGKVYAAGKYDNLTSEKRQFLNELHAIDERATHKTVELAQKSVTEREKHMIDIYGEIIQLVHQTIVTANGVEESRIPSIKQRFKRQLERLNKDLRDAASSSHHHVHHDGLKDKKEEILEKSMRFQNTYEHDVNSKLPDLTDEKRQKAKNLQKRISSQFEMFRYDVQNAKSLDEIEQIERGKYFGDQGSISKLKKKLDGLTQS